MEEKHSKFNKKKEIKVNVKIMDGEYMVRGDEDGEYIKMLAAYVDKKMRGFQRSNSKLSPEKIAVLTALNLADDITKLQKEYDYLLIELEQAKKELKERKNEAKGNL